jgi:hypothetical protein
MARGSDDSYTEREGRLWLMVSPPDANWKAPYSARFHVGASAPGG